MRGKGNIVNNKIVAELTRAAMKDAREYVRPAVLTKLREKLGGEAYYLFLRNTLRKDWETEAEKILAECECEQLLEDEEFDKLPCANCKEETRVDEQADDMATLRSCELFNIGL